MPDITAPGLINGTISERKKKENEEQHGIDQARPVKETLTETAALSWFPRCLAPSSSLPHCRELQTFSTFGCGLGQERERGKRGGGGEVFLFSFSLRSRRQGGKERKVGKKREEGRIKRHILCP